MFDPKTNPHCGLCGVEALFLAVQKSGLVFLLWGSRRGELLFWAKVLILEALVVGALLLKLSLVPRAWFLKFILLHERSNN